MTLQLALATMLLTPDATASEPLHRSEFLASTSEDVPMPEGTDHDDWHQWLAVGPRDSQYVDLAGPTLITAADGGVGIDLAPPAGAVVLQWGGEQWFAPEPGEDLWLSEGYPVAILPADPGELAVGIRWSVPE